MLRLVIVGIASGFAFAVMDVLVNANPLGRALYEAYKPLAKETVNGAAGMIIDLLYGMILAAVFLVLYESLPGELGILKGLSYALLVWIFRVLMYVITQWMTLKIPVPALVYTLVTGLVEMAVLGVLYGLLLRPWT